MNTSSPQSRLARWCVLVSGLSLALVLAGCNLNVVARSSWIEAPLLADGVADGSTGQYQGYDTTLQIRQGNTAWLKFSMDTLPSGDLWTLTSSDGATEAVRQSGAYSLTASKIVSARLVLLVQDVNQPGYLNIALSPDNASQCFSTEAKQPNCSVATASTGSANDADQPGTPLAVTRTGFYSFDVTDLVKQGIGNPSLAFALTPDQASTAGDFTIGSKEQNVDFPYQKNPPINIPTSLAPSARLYVTLSDAVGQVSTTDIYSTAPNVRNFRYSATDSAVAGTNYNLAEPSLLQGPPNTAQVDQGYFYALTPSFVFSSSHFKTAVDSAFPNGISIKQTLAVSTLAATPSPSPSILWYSMAGSDALTWNSWNQPTGGSLASSTLEPDVPYQTALLDLSAPTASAMKATYDAAAKSPPVSVGLGFAIAGTSSTSDPITLRMGGNVQPRYITAITPRPLATPGAYYDAGDNTYARSWCFKVTGGNDACAQGVSSYTTRARVGQSFPAIQLVSSMGLGSDAVSGMPSTALYVTDLHFSVPPQGASVSQINEHYFEFLFGIGATASRPLGYTVSLGTANDVAGKYDGVISMPGHNDRFVIHYENLPLPTVELSGPSALTLPWNQGQNTVSVPNYTLAVDDTKTNLDDGAVRWKLTSSNAADVAPTQVLNQGTGSQNVAMTFTGPGLRTLTATSQSTPAATASLDVVVQAATNTSLAVSAASVMTGQPITLTATVSGALPQIPGTVRWLDGSQVLGVTTLDSTGQAQLSITPALGSHMLSVEYLGDGASGMHPSASATVNVNVLPGASSVQAQVPDAISIGRPLLVQASVAAVAPALGVPEGQLSISLAGGTCTAVLVNGAGECTLTPTAAGSQSLAVNYPGSATFAASQALYSVQVNTSTSKISFTSSPNPSKPGEQVTFAVNVSTDSSSKSLAKAAPMAPGGTVVFTESAAEMGRVTLDATGSASWSTDKLTKAGTFTITATYSGDAQNAPASQTLVQTVAAAAVDATPVPTLGQWALILLSAVLGLAAAMRLCSRRRV